MKKGLGLNIIFGLYFCEEWELEDQMAGKTPCRRTAEALISSMNTVLSFLVFTLEISEDFEENKLPTLDIKLWIGKSNIILYEFFSKPMAANAVVMEKSALSTSVKTATLTEEIVRRLKHTSQRLECSSMLETLEEATQKMINSGHRNSFIERIMIQGIVKYERMVKRSKRDETEQGYRILHQPSGRCSVRLRKKVMARENWFKPKPREDDDIETKKCGKPKGQEKKKRLEQQL